MYIVPDVILTTPIFESSDQLIPSIVVTRPVLDSEDSDGMEDDLHSLPEDPSEGEDDSGYNLLSLDRKRQRNVQSRVQWKEAETHDIFKCLEDALVCPVCYDCSFTPVYQCERGHVFCAECRPRLFKCPVCRVSLGFRPIRNLVLEQLAQFL